MQQNRVDFIVHRAMDVGLRAGRFYRRHEGYLRKRADARCVTSYDDHNTNFYGGAVGDIFDKNYVKSLRLIWKAQLDAPYLDLRDANRNELRGHGAQVVDEVEALIERASSDKVKKEFDDAYSPEQREALAWIISLIVHGEAYALYTSSTLLPVVRGTGSKLGMSMQVMEEAKHYAVLRRMAETLFGGARPLHASARSFFERVARAKLFTKLFGMNIIIESFATQIFGDFTNFPGLRDILPQFHLDESRHCAFPQSYQRNGLVPEHITHDRSHKRRRTALLLSALPVVFDYAPYFDPLGRDGLAFFGKFIHKAVLLAERSGLPLEIPHKEFLGVVNLICNGYMKSTQPDRYNGFQDYCLLSRGDIREDMEEVETEIFGEDLYGDHQPLHWRFYRQAVEALGRYEA